MCRRMGAGRGWGLPPGRLACLEMGWCFCNLLDRGEEVLEHRRWAVAPWRVVGCIRSGVGLSGALGGRCGCGGWWLGFVAMTISTLRGA